MFVLQSAPIHISSPDNRYTGRLPQTRAAIKLAMPVTADSISGTPVSVTVAEYDCIMGDGEDGGLDQDRP